MGTRVWLAVLLLCGASLPVWATEEIVEAWRSPFGTARAVALDPRDNSCWAATGASVMHLSATGAIISQWNGFTQVESIALNPTDGSIWIGDFGTGSVIHLSADGTELSRRGGFREPCSVSVYPTDGSCWVADGGAWDSASQQTIVDAKVVHLSAEGAELWRSSTLQVPWGVSVDPNNGSCWVADIGNWDPFAGQYAGSAVVHFSASGSQIWRGTSFTGAIWVSVNPSDGSCWVGDRGLWDDIEETFAGGAVVHLKADGSQMWRGSPLEGVTRVAVDPADGSCWAADYWNTGMVHLNVSGAELWRGYEWGVGGLAVDGENHSCWAAGIRSVVHFAANGAEQWRGQAFFDPLSVSVDPNNGSCWVGDAGDVVHLSASGSTLWRSDTDAYCCAQSVSVDPGNSSVWVAASALPAVAHLAASGSEQLLYGGVEFPKAVSAVGGTCWVADWTSVMHLDADGTQLWQGTAFSFPTGVSVNSNDGSVWVADQDASQIIHLSESGGQLWRGNNFPDAYAVAANPNDGSCWAVDAGRGATPQAVHVSEGGAELWRGGNFVLLWSVSVNPSDDSCWVGDDSGVAHYASDGTLRWRGYNFLWAESVSVDPADGSCWVADSGNGQVVHLVLGPPVADFTASPAGGPAPLAVQFTDTSSGEPTSWAWDFGDGATSTDRNPSHQYQQVGTYDVSLTAENAAGSATVAKPRFILATFTDVAAAPVPHWALEQILACVDAGIVQGYWDSTYRPTTQVDRASMAVYIARALAGGDANVHVPTGVTEPTFPDVGTDHWAYRYIEYAVSPEANVVQGYPGGNYKPDEGVNRGQMAVYIARAMVSPTGDAAVPDPPANPTFQDVTAGSAWTWCYRHVEYLAVEGIVQGYWDGYHPERAVTRDQMAVYVARAFELAF